MYYIQSFIRSHEPLLRSSAMAPTLTDKTNAPLLVKNKVGPKSGLGPRRAKAVPTLALTTSVSTDTDGDLTVQSFVPFPSSPLEEDPAVGDFNSHTRPPTVSAGNTENSLKRPLPADSRRKRCQTPLSPSCHGASPRRRNSPTPASRPRPAAAASPPINLPLAKRPKKNRRVVADMQFAADVHRSILVCTRAFEDIAMAVDSGYPDVLRVQDRMLVERLSKSLRDQGCNPMLIDDNASLVPPSVESPKPGVDLMPETGEAANVADRVLVADAMPTCSGPACVSEPLPSSRSMSPPRSPSPPPAAGSRVYEMPQLVAAMLLRRHERAAKGRGSSPGSPRAHVHAPSMLRHVSAVSAEPAF